MSQRTNSVVIEHPMFFDGNRNIALAAVFSMTCGWDGDPPPIGRAEVAGAGVGAAEVADREDADPGAAVSAPVATGAAPEHPASPKATAPITSTAGTRPLIRDFLVAFTIMDRA